MDSNTETYKVIILEECIEEMKQIYDYIANNLKSNKSAEKLMEEVRAKILRLANTPRLYPRIGKHNRLNKIYRRIIIQNFIVLYTVDDNQKFVFISHMFFNRKNYL